MQVNSACFHFGFPHCTLVLAGLTTQYCVLAGLTTQHCLSQLDPQRGIILFWLSWGKKACCSMSREQRPGQSTSASRDVDAVGSWAGAWGPARPLQEAARDLGKVVLQLALRDALSPLLLVSNNLCFCIH